MEFIDPLLLNYCEAHSDKEGDLLADLNRQTHLKISQPRMLSGHLQGRYLSFLSRLKKPKYILEIGTYTGYSALCLAEGLQPSGKLFTIDSNEETNAFAKKQIIKSNFVNQIELIEGSASNIIPTLNFEFDLVFIDADKKNYSLYYDLVFDKVVKGGLIIADNVLWSGKVIQQNFDTDTSLIDAFNKKVQEDDRVKNLLLPLRDGLMVIEKL